MRRIWPLALLIAVAVAAALVQFRARGPSCSGPFVTVTFDFDGAVPEAPARTGVGCVKLVIHNNTWNFTGVPVTPNETVYDVLRNLSAWFGFELRVRWYALGPFIDGIAGVNSDPVRGRYWIYYVDGQWASVGAGSYRLLGGEHVLWRYEKVVPG